MLKRPPRLLRRAIKIPRVSPVWRGVTALAVASCLQAQEPNQDLSGKMTAFSERVVEAGLAPGFAVAIVRGDQTLFEQGFGLADLETGRRMTAESVFYIASSTKSFTGLAASILHERGELDLDASLADLLPGVKLAEGLDPTAITLRQLLTHTHGIANSGPVSFRLAYSGDHTNEQLVDLLSMHGPAESGTTYAYGNIGYNVAGLAMDAHLGVPWKDVLEREIFDPLGMTNTSGYISRFDESQLAMPHRPEPDGFKRLPYFKGDANMHSAGGLVTTAGDAARWIQANVNAGRVGNETLIDPSAIEAAQYPYAEQDDSFGSFQRTGYGLGWNTGAYDGESFTHHFGGFTGFHAHISFMPDQQVGVAVLVNGGGGGFAADLISRYAYDLLRDVPDLDSKWEAELASVPDQVEGMRASIRRDRDRRAQRPQELPYPLEAYAGVYESEAMGRLELTLEGGKLHAQIGRMTSAVEVFDNRQNVLRVELTGGGTVMPVEFDDGATRASRIRWLGQTFERAR